MRRFYSRSEHWLIQSARIPRGSGRAPVPKIDGAVRTGDTTMKHSYPGKKLSLNVLCTPTSTMPRSAWVASSLTVCILVIPQRSRQHPRSIFAEFLKSARSRRQSRTPHITKEFWNEGASLDTASPGLEGCDNLVPWRRDQLHGSEFFRARRLARGDIANRNSRHIFLGNGERHASVPVDLA